MYMWGYPLPVSTCRRIAQYHLSLICLHSARATWEWWPFPQCYPICRGGVALYLARVARLVKFKIVGGRPVLGARGTAGKFYLFCKYFKIFGWGLKIEDRRVHKGSLSQSLIPFPPLLYLARAARPGNIKMLSNILKYLAGDRRSKIEECTRSPCRNL